MASSSRAQGADAGGELQLEARHLAVLIVLVVVLCVASFLLGRWVERQRLGPDPAALSGVGEDGATIEEMGDVAEDLTFFDSLKSDEPVLLEGVAAEPEPAASGDVPLPPARESARPRREASSGMRSVEEGVMIQVLASRQRAPAEELRRRLREKGYTALLVPEGGAYKVRVGPYADRADAERVAAILREEEQLTTWIP